MKRNRAAEKNPKDLLRQAEKAAAKGDRSKSLELFESCIRNYMSQQMPFKALAAAKNAKTTLGPAPRVYSILIRLYTKLGLRGDAQEEFETCCKSLKKDDIPFFKTLSKEAFLDLVDIIEIIAVHKGQCIIRQHDKGEDIFVVLSGLFEVVRDNIKVSVLEAGDLFGELGFFHHDRRSATIKATSGARLIKIPSKELYALTKRHTCLIDALEEIYDARILKKANEDLKSHPLIDVYKDRLENVRFRKGQAIVFGADADITIVKHGIVEVDYDEKGIPVKRFLKPGSVIERFSGTARANTDVELFQGRITILGNYRNEGE
jgi:CRP-like cAMP-binding protein